MFENRLCELKRESPSSLISIKIIKFRNLTDMSRSNPMAPSKLQKASRQNLRFVILHLIQLQHFEKSHSVSRAHNASHLKIDFFSNVNSCIDVSRQPSGEKIEITESFRQH